MNHSQKEFLIIGHIGTKSSLKYTYQVYTIEHKHIKNDCINEKETINLLIWPKHRLN